MTPEQIDRVFGCGRLQMVTGKHVEVFREAAAPGTRRRYTKRFLHTLEADFGQWTEREWRILARLIGHGIACVPDVVQYDRGAPGGTRLVQTYDAGATVDQWATILPIMRNGHTLQHVFQDCAHWWALAHHCLIALKAIHELSVVHLDIKGDNVCIPIGPSGFDPHGADLQIFPRFTDLALIDFAFSLVSGESLTTALPIGWQTDYDYQSPRLLHALEAGRHGDLQPTRQLDWRCDMYSLGAMLKRYLPNDEIVFNPAQAGGWSVTHVQAAKKLILALREAHDGEATLRHPHERILELTAGRLADADMAASLAGGWTLARDANVTPVAVSPATPVTRLAPPLRVLVTPRVMIEAVEVPAVLRRRPPPPPPRAQRGRGRMRAAAVVLVLVTVGAFAIAAPRLVDPWPSFGDFGRTLSNIARAAQERLQPRSETPVAAARSEPVTPAPPEPAPGARPSDASSAQGDAGAPAQVDAPTSTADAGEAAKADALTSNADAGQAAKADALTSSAPAGQAAKKAVIDAAPATVAAAVTRPRSGTGAKVVGVPSRPPTFAHAPPRPPKLAIAPPRPPASTSKIAPSIAAATSAKRVRNFNAQSVPSAASATPVAPVSATPVSPTETVAASAAPPEPPVIESVVAATPAATAPAATGAPSKAAPVAAPRPKVAPLAESERRSILSYFTDVFRSNRGKAPIEDRTVPSASAPPGSRSPVAANALPAPRDGTGSGTVTASAPVAAATRVYESPSPASAPADDLRMSAAPSPANEAQTSPRDVAPRVAPPGAPPLRDTTRGSDTDAPDLAARARHTIAESVPHAAAQAQGEIARVLRVAASAGHPAQERNIVEAVRRSWPHYQIATSVPNISPASARQLNEEARHAYVVQRNAVQAFDLQLRAFGANPRDAEVAGNLAFLYLNHPMQAETARQLSLHAIALRSSQMREARVDDWSTLAIASALTRRQADATNAFYVAVALSRDLDRSCRGALSAVDRYGDIMVAPVQAMMSRIRQHGRGGESPYCAWPMNSRTARVF